MPAVRKRWMEQYGKNPDQGDVDRMFADYVPMQIEVLRRYTTLIPGCAQAINSLRQDFKMKIGSTTGRQSILMPILVSNEKTDLKVCRCHAKRRMGACGCANSSFGMTPTFQECNLCC